MATTGIILAGGKNRRLGRPKALEKVGGIPIIQRVADRLAPIINQLVIVTALDTEGLPANLGWRAKMKRTSWWLAICRF